MPVKFMHLKRIAIITNTLNGGGAEKVCLTLTQALSKQSHDAHLIVLKQRCDYELPEGINVHFIFPTAKVKLYRASIQEEAAKKLLSLSAKLGGFDVCFSNLDETHPIVAKANLPNTFYVLHNSVDHILKRTYKLGPIKYWRKRKAFAVLNNKNLIAVSRGVQHETENSTLIKARSICTIYNPLDIEDIQKKSLISDSEIPDKPYIIYVGRLAEQKRIDILLKAFNLVKHDVSLVMLGCDSKKIGRMIRRYNDTKQVVSLPFKQNPYPWIKNAKALVLSSDYEGFGMVLVEALVCGTLPVSTDCPHGPREILTGELERYLSPLQSPEALAKKIDDAIENVEVVSKAPILDEVRVDKVVANYLAKADQKENLGDQLKYPVTFYLPNYEKIEEVDQLDPYTVWKRMPRGEGFWILQTYCLLKNFGVDVNISGELPEEGVLVFHRRNKSALFAQAHSKIKNLILVGCRGDLHDLLVPDFELLQNNFFADGERRFAMTHWPMPNIIPRKSDRGNTIKKIAFKGFATQLHQDFQTQEWKDFLKENNIEWVQGAVDFTHHGGSTFDDSVWADYSDIDLVIAVRPQRNDYHTNKPALKLYNAWIAGVPAILGKECAYREIGTSGEDYIEANSLEDTKKAITYLIKNPDAYSAMVKAGRKKAVLYTHEAVCEAWKHFFYQILPEKIERRQQQLSYKMGRYIPLSLKYRLLFLWKVLTLQRMR